MRQIFLFMFLSFCVNVFATVRTVNNSPNSLAQYNNIQAAVDASATGDTIYVHGSNVQYAAFTITNKRLIVIGPGWLPIRNFAPFPAQLLQMTISGSGSTGTEIQGLVFVGTITMNGTPPPDNLRFIRNQFKSAVYVYNNGTSSNYIFQSNWFDLGFVSVTSSGATYSNYLFQNNIFYATSTNGNISGFTNSSGVLFDHNLWYGPTSIANTVNCFGGSCQSLLLTNNIFVHRDAALYNSLSTFNNNITFGCRVDTPWLANGNGGVGNIVNQDPQMFNQDSVNAGHENSLLNFTVASGPANNAGTDGRDLGLMYNTVGILNWDFARMSRLPYIYNMNISNSTIAPGGTLTVQVEARKYN
jgi:hypothetical protein